MDARSATRGRSGRAASARARHPDLLFWGLPKQGHALARDFKWLGSHRYGLVHLDGRDEHHLRERALEVSGMLGWPAPYADQAPATMTPHATQPPLNTPALESER